MTPAERSLLLALFRWARAEGITYGGANWWSRPGPIEQRWGIDFESDCDFLRIWRGRNTSRRYWVASITEAVDVLVALGIAPARFSTAYRAGWDAAGGAPESESRRVRPAVPR